MANKIRVDTECLSRWASQLTDVSEALTEAARDLGNVDTSDGWWRKVSCSGSVRLRDEGGSITLSSARSAVSQLENTLKRYYERVNKLSGAVRQAGINFDNAETDVCNLINNTSGEANSDVYAQTDTQGERIATNKTIPLILSSNEDYASEGVFCLTETAPMLGLAATKQVNSKPKNKTDWAQVWTHDDSQVAEYSILVDSDLKKGKKASITLELDTVYGGLEAFNIFGCDDIADAGRRAKYEITYYNGTRWITKEVNVGGVGHKSVKLEFDEPGNYSVSVKCIENGVIHEKLEIGEKFDATAASTRIRMKNGKKCSVN